MPPPTYVRDALLSKGSASSTLQTASSATAARESSRTSAILSSRTILWTGIVVGALAVVAAIAYSLFHSHYVVCHDGRFLSVACTRLLF
jgi:hypothetical protein